MYLQYCEEGNKSNWGEDNGNIVINSSDIGRLVCELDTHNLIAFMEMFSISNKAEAKENTFYKAKIYEYKKCKNSTTLLAKTSKDYYLFNLASLNTTSSSSEEIINIYTQSENNAIKEIEIFQKEELSKTIKDKTAIDSIISILKNCTTNYNVKEIIAKGFVSNDEAEYNKYLLKITFADETQVEVYINKEYFQFNITLKDDYGYYDLDKSDYNRLVSLIDN